MTIINQTPFKQSVTYPKNNLKKMMAKNYKICDASHYTGKYRAAIAISRQNSKQKTRFK